MQNTNTHQQVQRVLLITLALNFAIAASKILIGVFSGALSITADGFHSLIDGTSNIIALIANRLAERPPDEDHPYGHRRFETLGALLIGAFLLLVAWEITSGAIRRLQSGEQPELTIITFAVLVGTLMVNVFVSRYQIRQGKALKSELLLADAANTGADVFVTLSVIISMGLFAVTGWAWVDVIAALIVVGLILHAAWRILQQTGRVLVDTAPCTPAELEKHLEHIPFVSGILRARSRGSIDAAHIDIDVQVAPEMTAEQSSNIAFAIRERLEDRLNGVSEVEVHFVPMDVGEKDYALVARAAADALGLATHEVAIIETRSRKVMELHVEVPPAQTLNEAHQVVSQLEQNIRKRLPEIAEVITHIEPAHSQESNSSKIGTQETEAVTRRAMTVLQTAYPRVNWHNLKVYRHDDGMLLTLHAAMLPEVSVEYAHRTAEHAEMLLRSQISDLSRVTIHTEPETEA